MRLKVKPADFIVEETYPPGLVGKNGRYRVYVMTKRKLTTHGAVTRLAKLSNVSASKISFAGLKDKQAMTRQLITVDGTNVRANERDLKVRPLGRMERPLASKDVTGNKFVIAIRDLDGADEARIVQNADLVQKYGMVNYFDSQRFGCLRHGQGFAMRDVLKGRHEDALRRIIATPSALDLTSDAHLKSIIAKMWGKWDQLERRIRRQRFHPTIKYLADKPGDFCGALYTLPAALRTIHIYSYQSLLFNRAAGYFILKKVGKSRTKHINYDAGRLYFYTRIDDRLLADFSKRPFPLFDDKLDFESETVRWAYEKVFHEEGLAKRDLRSRTAGFHLKAEERPLVVFPRNLRIVSSGIDETEKKKNRRKVEVEFALPRGAYATLVVKRLYDVWPE